MSDSQECTLRMLILCVCGLLIVVALCVTYATTRAGQLGPEYVTIDGKHMRCVVLQVTQTETAASCDWDAIREAE